MYIEDMELCYRAHLKGYKVVHDPHAVVAHLGQGSSNKSFAIINIFKGLKIFYKKHKGKISYVLLVSLLTLKAWAAMIVGMLKKNQNLVDTYRKAITS